MMTFSDPIFFVIQGTIIHLTGNIGQQFSWTDLFLLNRDSLVQFHTFLLSCPASWPADGHAFGDFCISQPEMPDHAVAAQVTRTQYALTGISVRAGGDLDAGPDTEAVALAPFQLDLEPVTGALGCVSQQRPLAD